MTPYYERDGIVIYHGEALDLLRQLPSESVDVLMTDPPYSSGGMFRGDRAQSPKTKYSGDQMQAFRECGDFSGDSRDQRSWMAWVSAWSYMAHLATRPSGYSFVFADWRQLPAATDAIQLGGWVWRGLVTWSKAHMGQGMSNRFRMNAEYVVWGSRGTLPSVAGGVCASSVFEVVPVKDRDHPTQKPVELIQHLLRVVPGHPLTVLDPFCGSGSTLVGAYSLGHRAIGIEIEERYCEIAAKRLEQGVLPLGASA